MITLPIPSLDGLLTERLRFRRVRLSDLSWWMGYMNDATALRFIPYRVGSEEDGMAFLRRSMERYLENGSGLHALEFRTTDEPIGLCGLLTQEVEGVTELEIGYHLLPVHWHHGYATEAARACAAFAAERRLAPTVVSLIDPNNTLSQAVALRNGMHREEQVMFRGKAVLVFRRELTEGHRPQEA